MIAITEVKPMDILIPIYHDLKSLWDTLREHEELSLTIKNNADAISTALDDIMFELSELPTIEVVLPEE